MSRLSAATANRTTDALDVSRRCVSPRTVLCVCGRTAVYLRRSVPPSFFSLAFQRKEGDVCAGVPEEWTGVVPTRASYAARVIPDDVARALTDAYVGVDNGLLLECDVCESQTFAAVFHAARPDVKDLIASDLPDLWEATASTTRRPTLALVATTSNPARLLTRSN